MNAHEAVNIILSDKEHFGTSLNYAVSYARYELQLTLGSEDSRVQCLYILNNISHWRHLEAKEVRVALKKEAGLK